MRFLKSLGLQPGDVVALEGAPIYLSDAPGRAHEQANRLVGVLADALKAYGCLPELHVLLDELTCVEHPGTRNRYLEALPLHPVRITLESTMLNPGLELLGQLAKSRVQRGGGSTGRQCVLRLAPHPILVTNQGRPACSLMDSAFQLGKRGSLSIIVHPNTMMVGGSPVSFIDQQRGVLGVLSSRRTLELPKTDHLPWELGVLHFWLDQSGNVASSWRSWNKGRTVKFVDGAIRLAEINEALARLS